MNYRLKAICIAAAALYAAALSSCFTGVESTPRIGQSEVRRNNPGGAPPERRYLDNIVPSAPNVWPEQGHKLLIDDNRISRILAPGSTTPVNLKGRLVDFVSYSPAISLTGDDAVDITFRDSADSDTIICRIPVAPSAIDTISRLDIPFTIDISLVNKVDTFLRGQKLFVATPDWYDASGNTIFGLRHVEAVVDSVVPGTFIYPAAVYFTLTDESLMPDGGKHYLYMSVAGVGAQARSFDRLFEFESPRRRHPEIEDDTWQCIMRSRLRLGMTPAECRLALGTPTDILKVPTRGGMRETWSYSDGVFLVFEDGILTRFRQ